MAPRAKAAEQTNSPVELPEDAVSAVIDTTTTEAPVVSAPPGMAPYPAAVAAAIAKVMGGDLYVQKLGHNKFHGYKYATVGDLLDKIQPMMADAGLIILQSEQEMKFYDEGNVMAITYEFTLAHSSGVAWSEKIKQTGMSSCKNQKGGFDDKSANKCHTGARKYFLLGLFQVPTGENFRESLSDGDVDSQEDKPKPIPLPEIEKYEADLKERLNAIKDLDKLDDLWRSGANARIREIGATDKNAQNRMITAFSQKKNEIMKRDGTDEAQAQAS